MKSTHTLFLTFRYDYNETGHENYKSLSMHSGFRIRVGFEALIETLKESQWHRDYCKPEASCDAYNLYAEFSERIRTIVFDKENDQDASCNYTHALIGKHAHIKMQLQHKEHMLDLKLTDIGLRIFETGVGLLRLELLNEQCSSSEEAALINRLFSSLYPGSMVEHDGGYRDENLCESFSLEAANEVFYRFDNHFDTLPRRTKILDFFTYLLDTTVFTTNIQEPKKYFIHSVVGQQLFVMCNIDDFLPAENSDEAGVHKTLSNLLNVQQRRIPYDLEGNAILVHRIWKDAAAYFALSNHSCIILNENEITTLNACEEVIAIMLGVRSSIDRLLEEVVVVSEQCKPEENNMISFETLEYIEELYRISLNFMSRFHYKAIVNDYNAELMHSTLSEFNKTEKRVTHLTDAIKSLYNIYNYSKIINDKQQQEFSDKLAVLGGIFVPAGVISGIYGMNVPIISEQTWKSVAIVALVTYGIAWLFLSKNISRAFMRLKEKRK